MPQREAPDLASALYPNLPRDPNSKSPQQRAAERRAAERAAAERASLLKHLREANVNLSKR